MLYVHSGQEVLLIALAHVHLSAASMDVCRSQPKLDGDGRSCHSGLTQWRMANE